MELYALSLTQEEKDDIKVLSQDWLNEHFGPKSEDLTSTQEYYVGQFDLFQGEFQRFADPVTDQQIDINRKNRVPENTRKATKWGFTVTNESGGFQTKVGL